MQLTRKTLRKDLERCTRKQLRELMQQHNVDNIPSRKDEMVDTLMIEVVGAMQQAYAKQCKQAVAEREAQLATDLENETYTALRKALWVSWASFADNHMEKLQTAQKDLASTEDLAYTMERLLEDVQISTHVLRNSHAMRHMLKCQLENPTYTMDEFVAMFTDELDSVQRDLMCDSTYFQRSTSPVKSIGDACAYRAQQLVAQMLHNSVEAIHMDLDEGVTDVRTAKTAIAHYMVR